MLRYLQTIAVAAALIFGVPGSLAAATPSEAPASPAATAAIGRLADAYVKAWNAHDARAFSSTYTSDADLTNIFGVSAHGRDGIVTLVSAAFGGPFGSSTQTLDDRTIRYITPAIASVDFRWSLTGATVPGWPPVQHGLQTWIVTKQADGEWLIAVLHNQILPASAAPR